MSRPAEHRGEPAAPQRLDGGFEPPAESRADAPFAPSPRRTPSVLFRAVDRTWSAWWPCEACGGVEVPLRPRPTGSPVPECELRSCPRCEGRRRRHEPPGAGPDVWYDAALADWVLRPSYRELPAGALIPLGIRWFDADWAQVYRAAADVAYAGDELDGEPGSR